MQRADVVILVAYLGTTLAIGAFFARRQRDPREFYLAGRSMGWFPIGLSTMVTAFSAINITAYSGEILSQGSYVLLCLPVFLFVAWPITRFVIPLYYRMQISNVYEYLERRFDRRVRWLASWLFVFWRVLWLAVVVYVPSKVMSITTGWDERYLIVVAGAAATIYTTAGGMTAVMWTDTLQFFVMLTAVIIGIAVTAAETPGGLRGIFQLGLEHGLLRPFSPFDAQVLSPDPRVRITLWSCWIGMATALLTRYGVDQAVVQRYFTARSLAQAKRGFHLNYSCAIVSLGSLAALGFAIHAHVVVSGAIVDPGTQPIVYFAAFVRALPAGVSGLLVAALLAATMSSVDSGIHACSAVFFADAHRDGREGSELVTLSRFMILALGVVVTLLAMYIGRIGSVFEIANKIINGLGSPLLALFLVGMFSRRATAWGMLVGGLAGVSLSATVSLTVESLALHYYAVANLIITAALCFAFSLADRCRGNRSTPDQLQWAWPEAGRRTAGQQGPPGS